MAVYARISRDSDGRAEGVATQERNCRKLAAKQWPELPVVAYVDNDISAAKPGTVRPSFDRMVAAIRRGEVAQVVCAEQSRLTRQPAELEALMLTLATAGIAEIHTTRGGTVPVKGSRLVGRILAAVDAEEVERLRARIMDRQDSDAAAGRPGGGTMFGYRHGRDEAGAPMLVIEPAEAEVIRWAAGRVLAGWSLGSIARDLRDRDVPTRRGGVWRTQNVRSFLRSPTTAGLRMHRGEIIGEAAWEPILEPDLWRQVGAVLDSPRFVTDTAGDQRLTSTRRRAPRRYLLTGGLGTCGRCGTRLTAQQRYSKTSTGRRASYLCSAAHGGCNGIGIVAEELEDYVARSVLDRLAAGVLPRVEDHAAERARIFRELDALAERRTTMAAMAVGDGALSMDEWVAARKASAEREGQLRAELAALPVSDTVDGDETVSGWAAMPLEERRHVLGQVLSAVEVGPVRVRNHKFDKDRVTLHWR